MQAIWPVKAVRLQAHERKLVGRLGILAVRRSRRRQTEVRRYLPLGPMKAPEKGSRPKSSSLSGDWAF